MQKSSLLPHTPTSFKKHGKIKCRMQNAECGIKGGSFDTIILGRGELCSPTLKTNQLKGSPPLCHPERLGFPETSKASFGGSQRSRTRGGLSARRSLRERVGRRPPRDLYERFLLACLEISNIIFGFSYAPLHRRFRSHARALFTLPRVNKVRLRTGLLSHRSPIITPLCSAQNDAYRGAACCSRLFLRTCTPLHSKILNFSVGATIGRPFYLDYVLLCGRTQFAPTGLL